MSAQKCTELTIVLPWVHITTTPEYIRNIFKNLNWGKIDSTKFIERKQTTNPRTGKVRPSHYKVFIRLVDVTKEGNDINTKLGYGKEVKVNHSHGFWKIERRDPVYQRPEEKTKTNLNRQGAFESLFQE